MAAIACGSVSKDDRTWYIAVVAADLYCDMVIPVDISFDSAKRAATLENRGLDFADAGLVFATEVLTRPDDRFDYGEPRFITAGYLRERIVVLVWTPRGTARHVISMRYVHAKEARRWHASWA